MKQTIALLLAGLSATAGAAGAPPPVSAAYLPADAVVARVLREAPDVRAAADEIGAEQANRRRVAAGPYEWNLRLGGQQRRSLAAGGGTERFAEWNAALESPLRLPGKASLDEQLGAAGVAQAELAYGDALHERSRFLLASWFDWLRKRAAVEQWTAQVGLLDGHAKAVRRRQQLGDASRVEATQSEAALAEARAELARADSALRVATETLQRRFPGLPLAAPADLPEPPPLEGTENHWLQAIVSQSHELALAQGQARKAGLDAGRSGRDRLPDPTVGIQVSRERGGEDRIVGAYVSIPLPGTARRAGADAALARAAAANQREAATLQKITAETAAAYQAARSARDAWLASRDAADRLREAATMTARAYRLGEGSLSELLNSRRLANDAELAARLRHLDALEGIDRLRLDAHRLWDIDAPGGQ